MASLFELKEHQPIEEKQRHREKLRETLEDTKEQLEEFEDSSL